MLWLLLDHDLRFLDDFSSRFFQMNCETARKHINSREMSYTGQITFCKQRRHSSSGQDNKPEKWHSSRSHRGRASGVPGNQLRTTLSSLDLPKRCRTWTRIGDRANSRAVRGAPVLGRRGDTAADRPSGTTPRPGCGGT